MAANPAKTEIIKIRAESLGGARIFFQDVIEIITNPEK
jgi:hypothetical protein